MNRLERQLALGQHPIAQAMLNEKLCGAQALLEVARSQGLEAEVLHIAKHGKLQVQKESPPNLRSFWRGRGPPRQRLRKPGWRWRLQWRGR